MQNKKQGLFITFEGADGCGKTTQLNLLQKYLEEKGFEIVVTREPGAKGLGEEIRKLLLHYDGYISPKCEAFMFLADRAQHIDTIVKTAVNEGKIVLCDRHTDSTIAYQGYGRGEDIEKLKYLNNLATSGFTPDLTIVCDVDIETAIKRRGNDRDRMEQAGKDFQIKVQNGYREIAKLEPNRVKIIDAKASVEEVFESCKKVVEQLIKKRYN
ncbi:dTMP kinase [bacterium]|nr:dTMP kinase [bacterium]